MLTAAEVKALRPMLEAAKSSIEYHANREDVEYPDYVWIDWADLVRFVEVFDQEGR